MTTPLRTADRDANYLSLNLDTVVLYAGTPDEVQFHGDIPTIIIPEDVKRWDSALKCSNRHDTSLTGLSVAQGKENALDINASSSHLTFDGDWGVVGQEGEQVITAKGGSRVIALAGIVHSRGRRADLVCGLWSDQSDKVSRDLDLSGLRHVTGRPLTVILCRVNGALMAALGKPPKDIVLPVGAKVLLWKSLGAQAGWWLKWVAVKLGLFR